MRKHIKYNTTYFFAGNKTLLDELYKGDYDNFSFDILYEVPAGPGHYLTLVHSRRKVNDTVIDTE